MKSGKAWQMQVFRELRYFSGVFRVTECSLYLQKEDVSKHILKTCEKTSFLEKADRFFGLEKVSGSLRYERPCLSKD